VIHDTTRWKKSTNGTAQRGTVIVANPNPQTLRTKLRIRPIYYPPILSSPLLPTMMTMTMMDDG
jgi:hypothetical protein